MTKWERVKKDDPHAPERTTGLDPHVRTRGWLSGIFRTVTWNVIGITAYRNIHWYYFSIYSIMKEK